MQTIRTRGERSDFRLPPAAAPTALPRADYERELLALQRKMARIQQAYLRTGDSAAIVFEGWDAGGKGGTIRRLSASMDPRGYKVWPIAAPRPHESERHYLQRFWVRLPPEGGISVFDRSWYGRVLVERVEDFASKKAWRRAYREIRQFERLLADDRCRIVKLFLHVSEEEQLRRFQARARDPLKRWKLTTEDLRNRARRPAYEAAVTEMVRRTARKGAPWFVIPADDKRYARIAAIGAIAESLASGVDLEPAGFDDATAVAIERELGVRPNGDEAAKG